VGCIAGNFQIVVLAEALMALKDCSRTKIGMGLQPGGSQPRSMLRRDLACYALRKGGTLHFGNTH